MSFTLNDLHECLGHRDLVKQFQDEGPIAMIHKGHGYADSESGTDWSGGFVIEFQSGRWGYLSGWCDYTGWG